MYAPALPRTSHTNPRASVSPLKVGIVVTPTSPAENKPPVDGHCIRIPRSLEPHGSVDQEAGTRAQLCF